MLKRSLSMMVVGVCLMTMTTGCIGRMAVAGKVMEWNLRVAQEKWPREIVFFLLYVVPVYPIAGAIDLIIVNSIEFWTGTNPVNGEARLARAGDRHEGTAEDGSRAVSVVQEDGSLDMTITGIDGRTQFVNLSREGTEIIVRDVEGNRVGHVNTNDQVVLTSQNAVH